MSFSATPDPDRDIAEPIQLILSDVDGVMTDGRIIYDNAGVETKMFHVRDGLGIKLWQKSGFSFGIITSRNSQIVRVRAAELGVAHVRQGFDEKLPAVLDVMKLCSLQPPQVCYIGDDLPDLAAMRHVGLAAAPADACADVRQAAKWVLRNAGGNGCVRELIERLLRAKSRWEEHTRP
jgi:3-deoxy-D-manno-octulosonate 8-phosphate phosphatase (KDO 8-P phosphatase)